MHHEQNERKDRLRNTFASSLQTTALNDRTCFCMQAGNRKININKERDSPFNSPRCEQGF